jgi:hypothetical protein
MPRRLLTAATITRPGDTTTYASGDLIANSTTAGSVVAPTFTLPSFGRELLIPRVKITKSAGPVANGSFRAHFFSGTVTVTTNGDNAAFTPTSMALYIGYIDVTMVSPLGGWGWATDSGAPAWVPSASSDALNVLLEARAAYVPTNAEVFTIIPEIETPVY